MSHKTRVGGRAAISYHSPPLQQKAMARMLDKSGIPAFWRRLKGFALSRALCGLFESLDVRIAHYDTSSDPAHPDFGEPCLWVFWHEYILSPIAMWRGCDVTMLVSQSRDGAWLTDVGQRLGFPFVRGSTSKGGTEAIRAIRRLCNSSGVGITPDGPRGPRREMVIGPIFLASRLGMPIIPTGFGFEDPWRLNSWDKFAVPKPFSRSRIVMGPRIEVPPKLRRDDLEHYQGEIERMINEVTETAETWAESGERLPGSRPFVRQPHRGWRAA